MSIHDVFSTFFMRGLFAGWLAAGLGIGAAGAGPGLGKPLSQDQAARIPATIYPDGRGLPAGRGTAAEGQPIYIARCQSCHGVEGRGGSGGELVGEGPLAGPDPDRAVNNYWPFATTLFDFIRRAMPPDAPGSLDDDEAYALTAYVLNIGGIVANDSVIDETTLPRIRMPNREGFDAIDASPGAQSVRRVSPGRARSARRGS